MIDPNEFQTELEKTNANVEKNGVMFVVGMQILTIFARITSYIVLGFVFHIGWNLLK